MINHIESERKVARFTVALTGILEVEIKSRSRNKHFVRARSIYAHIMRRHGFSYPEIGEFLSRDHTTIMNLVRIYDERKYATEIEAKINEAFPELSPESTAPIITISS